MRVEGKIGLELAAVYNEEVTLEHRTQVQAIFFGIEIIGCAKKDKLSVEVENLGVIKKLLTNVFTTQDEHIEIFKQDYDLPVGSILRIKMKRMTTGEEVYGVNVSLEEEL